jgi:hypothetical protein
MKNLWPDSFEAAPIKTPKEIMEEQGKLLPKLTGDMVYAEVADINLPFKKYDFNYGLRIRGKFIENYSLHVFSVMHDILVYPIRMSIDEAIAKELGLENKEFEFEDQENFEKMFEAILKSQRVNKVIGTLIKMSNF